jgi:hypothetical protein
MASATAQADTAQSVCNIAPIGILPPNSQTTYQVGCGHVYTFKYGTLTGGDGNYRALLLNPCPDGPCGTMNMFSLATFLCQLRNGYHCCITIKDWIFLERGRDVRVVKSGLDYKFERDTDRNEGICYSDYHGNGSRIIFVPITSPEVAGDSGVWVHGVAAFFLRYRLGSTDGALVGEFVNAIAPGTPNGHPETGGPVTFALHLVR